MTFWKNKTFINTTFNNKMFNNKTVNILTFNNTNFINTSFNNKSFNNKLSTHPPTIQSLTTKPLNLLYKQQKQDIQTYLYLYVQSYVVHVSRSVEGMPLSHVVCVPYFIRLATVTSPQTLCLRHKHSLMQCFAIPKSVP